MTEFNMFDELVKARAYSRALRHLYRAGLQHLEPLTYDDELCRWNGKLLPLEQIDRNQFIRPHEVEHGTERGYQWHRRRGVPTCDLCRVAHNATTRKSNKRTNRRMTA